LRKPAKIKPGIGPGAATHGPGKSKFGVDSRQRITSPLTPASAATITEALALEHAVLGQIFDQMEGLLHRVRTVEDVTSLADLVLGWLHHHWESEWDLAYSVLDHVLTEYGAPNQLRRPQDELERHYARVHRAADPVEATYLLILALMATRDHFRCEEELVFPALEEMLQPATLLVLGNQWWNGYFAAKN
jgi:hemerythrin-like domain-containing protein